MIETVGGDTVRFALAIKRFEPQFAPIAIEPPAAPTATPVPLIVATAWFDELHATELVTSSKLPSL